MKSLTVKNGFLEGLAIEHSKDFFFSLWQAVIFVSHQKRKG